MDSLIALETTSFQFDRFHRRQLLYLMTRAKGAMLVYEKDTHVAGMIILTWRQNSNAGRILSIAVQPEFQSHGIGGQLLKSAESRARAKLLTRMRLEVRADNTQAVAFYEHHSYYRVAALPAYYWDGSDGVRYEKTL